MPNTITYNPTDAHKLLKREQLDALAPDLLAARDEAFADIELYRSGNVPEEKDPLDAAFIDLPERLLADYESPKTRKKSEVNRIIRTAAKLRDELDRVVSLGIGGSYMGARALFEALCHPYHNELTRSQRKGVPRIYFEGNNVDNDAVRGLLRLLPTGRKLADKPKNKWGVIVISKSGGTMETAAAFRVFRLAAEERYGAKSNSIKKYIVPVTGKTGKLRDLANEKEYAATFPVPDGVGGRFSVLSAVGLLPAAVMGLDIVQLLQGAADMNAACKSKPLGENPVLDYTATCHLFEKHHGMSIRILSTWGTKLEALGFWYDQLLSESLGKKEKGATPITGVNTRDLHSRGQQHQEGRRDKLITNLIVETPSKKTVEIPECEDNQDKLNRFAGKPFAEVLAAAVQGTNEAYADANRPTADIVVKEKLDEYAMGQLFQFFMLATVVEGRLIGINPYGQPGVEAYKRNMERILAEKTK